MKLQNPWDEDKSASMRKAYLNRFENLRDDRQTYLDHWKDIADFMLPRHYRLDSQTVYDYRNSGTKKNQKIINNTATRALRVMASGMMAGITSPARPWFRLTVPDAQSRDIRSVRIWLSEVESILREVFLRSNIYNVLAALYRDLGAFGVSPIIVEEDEDSIIRAYIQPIGSYMLSMDAKRRVDTIYRETTMSVRNINERFERENISPGVVQNYEAGKFDQRIDVVHVIEPNADRDMLRDDAPGMPWSSVWIERTASAEQILGVGGYRLFPVMAPRWTVVGEDVYAESPGMEALGDTRALQKLESRKLMAVDKIVTPPMNAPASMQQDRLSLLPGDVNYGGSDQQGGRFEPAYVVDGRIVMIQDVIREHENRINSSFFADLFLMMSQQPMRGGVTAREVEERHEEKMLQLGPVLERLQDELLDPLIDRTFDVLSRRDMLPPPPPELAGRNLKVEYISILAQAQKLLGTVGIERLTGFVQAIAQVDPEAMDRLDADRAIAEYGELLGTAPDLIRSDDEVNARRQERAKAQQAQAAAEQAKLTAGAAKDASQAELTNDSALKRMLSSAGAMPGGEA